MRVFQRISCLILFLLLYPIILLNLDCTQQQNHSTSELEGAVEIKRFPFILLMRGLIKNATKEKWAEWCKVTLIELVRETGRDFS